MKLKYLSLLAAVVTVLSVSYFIKIAPAYAEVDAANEQLALSQLTIAALDTLNASGTKSDSAFSQINKVLSSNSNRFVILGVVTDAPRATFIDAYNTIPERLVESSSKTMATKSANHKYCFTILKNKALSTKDYTSLNIEIRSSADNFYAPVKTIKTAMVNRS